MFEQSLLVAVARTRRAWTVPVSFAGQVVVIGLLVLMPFVFVERLPRVRIMPVALTAPAAYVPPPVSRPSVAPAFGTWRDAGTRPFVAPAAIPAHVAVLVDPVGPPLSLDPAPPCVGLCVVGGIPGAPPALTTQTGMLPAAPVVFRADPQVEPARPVERITIGGVVQAARLIARVQPAYPHTAVITRTTGVVRLAAVIAVDGRVRELRVLGGNPLLIPAAIDAVRQWVYRPTMLNGAPVEVATDITVTFRLSA